MFLLFTILAKIKIHNNEECTLNHILKHSRNALVEINIISKFSTIYLFRVNSQADYTQSFTFAFKL